MGMFDRAMDDFVTVKYSSTYDQPASVLWQVAIAYAYSLRAGLPFVPYCADAPDYIKECLRPYYPDVYVPSITPAPIWTGCVGTTSFGKASGPGSIAGACYSPQLFGSHVNSVLEHMRRFAGGSRRDMTAVIVDNKINYADCTRRSTSAKYLRKVWSMLSPDEKKHLLLVDNMYVDSYKGIYGLDKLLRRPDERLHMSTLEESLTSIRECSSCGTIVMAPNHVSWWAAALADPSTRVLYPYEWARAGVATAETPMPHWEMVSVNDMIPTEAKWPGGCLADNGYTFTDII